MLKPRKVRDVLGFGNVTDLIAGFEQVGIAYRAAMENHLFRHSPIDVPVLAVDDIMESLKVFQRAGNRYYVADFLTAYAILQLGDHKANFLAAVEGTSANRATHNRLRKMLEKMEMNSLSLQLVMPSKHTQGELYGELKREVLAA
jgi:hypothetical protein